MKRFYTILLLGTVLGVSVTCAFAATYTKFSSKFIKNFEDCDKYTETITSEFEGKTFTTTRNIMGWKNGFCKYQEVISSTDGKYQLSCSFTGAQMDELYEAMKSRSRDVEKYDLERFAETVDENGKKKYVSMGSETIKGNKAYIAWAKYQNNPYFCKPQKLQ